MHERHGHSTGQKLTPTYNSWRSMRQRCLIPSAHAFKRYGGRGIRICPRWNSFEAFITDMGERPTGTSLDRINNDGHYEPGNCRWATRREQARNKRDSRIVTFGGTSQTVIAWSETTGIARATLAKRLKDGWAVGRALTAPVRKVGPYRRREAPV